MTGGAYYNEIDPLAAQTIREAIAAGAIAPGVVDERDIRDIRPDDLDGFTQCHFFAGGGLWSYALRRAGWPDDEPAWTASCPCPPFSSAGRTFRCPRCDTPSPVPNAVRTGAFDCIRCGHEWQADTRHLFPEFFRLARHRRPQLILGEQVASKDGRTWIDIVRASLEMLGYAVGHVDTCSAGVGAPNIRQRLFWMADVHGAGLEGRIGLPERPDQRTVGADGVARRLAGAVRAGQPAWRPGAGDGPAARSRGPGDGNPGPVNGFWADADWVLCRDPGGPRWRPVEAGTFPLAPGHPGRVGGLRLSGNAINPEVATGFIEAVIAHLPDRPTGLAA